MPGKFIIYQLLPRLFGNTNENCIPNGSLEQNGTGKFSDIDTRVIRELKRLSVTHLWYTGIIRHSVKGDQGVKGEAGSPYAISDYYDVNPYLSDNPDNRISEFEALILRTHNEQLGVIIDFVPNHLSKAYNSKIRNFTDDNFYPGRIYDYEWSDTVKLNYAKMDTWIKMTEILLFWASMGVDGFRCDMVELVPVEFWTFCITKVKMQYPKIIFIAEIYRPENYREYVKSGKFDYIYDKSGFYDTLRGIITSNASATSLTGIWQGLGELQPQMLNFLENHDEQRIASDFFVKNPFKILPALYVSLFFNTSPFLLYFGQEFGESGMDAEGFSQRDGRTSIFDYWSVPSVRRWLMGVKTGDSERYLIEKERDIYHIYLQLLDTAMQNDVFRYGATFDLQYVNPPSEMYNPNRQFAFLRYHEKRLFLCVANFEDCDRDLLVNIPLHTFDFFGIPQTDSLSAQKPIRVNVSGCSGTLVELIN